MGVVITITYRNFLPHEITIEVYSTSVQLISHFHCFMLFLIEVNTIIRFTFLDTPTEVRLITTFNIIWSQYHNNTV